MDTQTNYSDIAKAARLKILDLVYRAQTSHIGSNFSVIDILTVLYEQAHITKEDWDNRDRIILSKGWAAASLYYFLHRKGLLTEEDLRSYCQPGSKFIGLAEPVADGIEFAGGSMGHGLPAGVGMALAAKKLKKDYKVYVVMSDGELQCGTTWESFLLIRQHKLDNLKVLVDVNGWQAMGRTKDILQVPLEIFDGEYLDGHDYRDIEQALDGDKNFLFFATIKGKGVSIFEDKLIWHYKNIDAESYRKALHELT